MPWSTGHGYPVGKNLLRVRAAEGVDHANANGVLGSDRTKRRSRQLTRAIGKYVLVRHVTPVFNSSNDLAGQHALYGQRELAQGLRGSSVEAVVIVEPLTAGCDVPLVAGS